LIQAETVIIPVQINGKRRGEIEVGSQETEDGSLVENKAREVVAKQLEGVEIKKTIYVPGKIVNFVV
jgi:leucyl-tRNA synthetase